MKNYMSYMYERIYVRRLPGYIKSTLVNRFRME